MLRGLYGLAMADVFDSSTMHPDERIAVQCHLRFVGLTIGFHAYLVTLLQHADKRGAAEICISKSVLRQPFERNQICGDRCVDAIAT